MGLSREIKAIRAHDIQPGLTSVNMGLVNAHMKRVKLIGASAQIATLLKGQNVIDYPALEVAVGDLGVDENLLEKALQELEVMDLVSLIRRSGSIVRVEERIPLLQTSYSVLGERIDQLGLSEIEQAALEILDNLSLMPVAAADLREMQGLSSQDFGIIRDIGKNAGFIDDYTSPSDSKTVLFSPVYWEDNPKQFFELSDRYGSSEVMNRLRLLRNVQGQPVELVTDEVVRQAIDLGCLPTPTVDSMAGEKAFAFTPIVGVGKYEKSLLTKARAIVACMRYGEHYGSITRIRNPKVFLQRVIERRGTLRSHTEVPQQWELARKLGIGYFDREIGTDRYFFRLNDAPENMRAFELAIQMISVGDVERPNDEEDGSRSLLMPGSFVHPSVTRIRVRRAGKYSRDNIILINDLIRGVSSDLF